MGVKTQRAVSFSLALIFFVSTIGIAFYYILVANSNNKQQQELQELLNQQQDQGGEKLQGKALEGFEPLASIASLQTIDTVEGTGDAVKTGDTVTVHYTGATAADGIVFQSSLDGGQPVSFGLDGVIKGWTEGIPGMKVGGTRRLLIPAALAYGSNPPAGSGIPADADLVFDVQLLGIGQ